MTITQYLERHETAIRRYLAEHKGISPKKIHEDILISLILEDGNLLRHAMQFGVKIGETSS